MMALAANAAPTPAQAPATHFLGILRGELFKMSRQRTNWIMAILAVGVVAMVWTLLLLINNPSSAQPYPLNSVVDNLSGALAAMRVFIGFALIVITARTIELDYQMGTIRIVLARGVERLQLLGAKLLAITIVGAALLVIGLVVNAIFALIYYSTVVKNVDLFNVITPTAWVDLRLYVLTIIISMIATVLMTAAFSVLGRSLTVGLSVGLSFFAADNIGVGILTIIYRITNNDFWLNLTGYLLGPALNALPTIWIKDIVLGGTVHLDNGQTVARTASFYTVGSPPRVNYDLTHFLVLITLYCVAFAALAVGLTWRRDVLE